MSGFSDPEYNTRQQISSLRLRMQHMETELHQLRSASVPKCRFCGEQISYQSQVFRCADCEAPFHRGCIRKHFANEPHPASSLPRPHGGIDDCDCVGAVIGQHDRSCPLASHNRGTENG